MNCWVIKLDCKTDMRLILQRLVSASNSLWKQTREYLLFALIVMHRLNMNPHSSLDVPCLVATGMNVALMKLRINGRLSQ